MKFSHRCGTRGYEAALVSGCLALCSITSCAATIPLATRWEPLTRVVENGNIPRHAVVTAFDTVFVHDLAEFRREYPAGPELEALLYHEREHARRQREAGELAWLARWAVDAPFRWQEEKIGWTLELRALRDAGFSVNADFVAGVLSGELYTVLGVPMVTRDEARAFALSVLTK